MKHFSYQSQYDSSVSKYWQSRICGIACVKMVLDSFGVKISLSDLLGKGREIGGHDSKFGWRHDSLVELLNSGGVKAHREEKIEVKSLIKKIEKGLPAIVSVKVGFDGNDSTHLILFHDLKKNEGGEVLGFIYHDPNAEKEPKNNQFITTEKFLKYWRNMAIFVDEK